MAARGPAVRRPLPLRCAAPALLRGTLAGLLALAASWPGCAKRVPVEGAPADTAAAARLPEYVFVAVENRHSSDVVVTLVRNGQSSRLGLVSGSSSTTLRFPGTYIANSATLQLSARAIGGNSSYQTGQFIVQPGQGVTLTLESQLSRSSFSVF